MPEAAPEAYMAGHEWIGTAHVPDGVEMRLMQRGDEFTILLARTELMSTRVSASEQALATMTCQRLAGIAAPQLLIGGYGMGFTLRAALAVLGPDASVTVAELVPEVIEWARGPMHKLTADCLDDPRVMLVEDDVALLIDAAQNAYDAILLDVDNGPDGLTRADNDDLYENDGLRSAHAALRPGGILAVWSAEPDTAFADRLARAGFAVDEVPVRVRRAVVAQGDRIEELDLRRRSHVQAQHVHVQLEPCQHVDVGEVGLLGGDGHAGRCAGHADAPHVHVQQQRFALHIGKGEPHALKPLDARGEVEIAVKRLFRRHQRSGQGTLPETSTTPAPKRHEQGRHG